MTLAVAWDLAARAWIVAHRVRALDGVMWTLSAITRGGLVWLTLGAVIAVRRRRPGEFLLLAVALLVTTIVADRTLKPLIHRNRPFVTTPSVHVIGGKPDDFSFPSGHAANSFAAALVLSTTAPAARVAWWALAAAIAYSRVYLGVHYPLDVAGGAIVGLLCAGLVLWASRAVLPTSYAGNLRNVRR